MVVTWWASLLTGHLKMARAQVTGGRQGGNVDGQTTYEGVGKVEGCFNTFDVLLDVTFTPPDFLNNLKCRKLCASHRFCMSATTGSRCLCGNNFPSVFHRVSDDQCSNPCAPDRKTCETAACCGDRVGKYYSVSFAREIDVGLQLLRQLAMDYRTQNPIFQAYIESMMGSSAFLQVADFRTTAGYEGAGTAAATPMGSLGFGNGCPQGWTIFKRSCYRRFTGKLVSYQSARSSCQNQGVRARTEGAPFMSRPILRTMRLTSTSARQFPPSPLPLAVCAGDAADGGECRGEQVCAEHAGLTVGVARPHHDAHRYHMTAITRPICIR